MSQDVLAPVLVSYQLSSYDIDLSAGNAVIEVTARIQDDLSGVFDGSSPAWNAGASQCMWRSPSGQIFWGGYFDDLASGTPLDGAYTDILTLSSFSENGVWTLEQFDVVDEAGNLRSYNTEQLGSLGIRTTLNVTGGVNDATAPVLVSYQLSSYDIDLSAGNAVIEVTARIQDDLSGVFDGSSPAWNAGASQCMWRSPSGQIFWGGYFDDLASGTPLDGAYTDILTLTKFAEKGIWTLEHFEVVDEAGNLKQYNTSELSILGIQTTFSVKGNWIQSANSISITTSVDNVELIGDQNINANGSSVDNIMLGNSANNVLNGGRGNDSLIGGAGIDTANYSTATAAVTVDLINNRASGGLGTDTLKSIERAVGGSAADSLIGNSAANKLNGGGGNDNLNGGLGKDSLTGSTGVDKFIYRSTADSRVGSAVRDVITDFRKGAPREKIDLSAIDAYSKTKGNQAFTYIGSKAFTGTKGEARFSGGVLQMNTGTDKIADMEIALSGVTAFSSTFLVL